jgi:acetyl-CoA carboxylase biotin carboxyl carrier protein
MTPPKTQAGSGKRRSTARAGAKKSAKQSVKPASKKNVKPAAAPAARESRAATRVRGGDPARHPTVLMVRELAAIVETHSLTEVIVEMREATLTIRRGGTSSTAAPVPAVHASLPMPVAPAPAPQAAPESRAEPEPLSHGANGEHHIVTSPFVGTFYRRPGPDADLYVETGARVEKGQVLCIVEAMKLMNEIEADVSGTLVAILVDDAEPVEYGQPLFKITPA